MNCLILTFYQMNPPQTNQLRKMGSITLRIWESKCTLLVGSLQKSTVTWWLNLITISCRIYRYLKRDSASLFFKAPMEFPRDVCPAIMPDVTDRRCCAGDFRGWEMVEEKGNNPGGDWHPGWGGRSKVYIGYRVGSSLGFILNRRFFVFFPALVGCLFLGSLGR